MHSKQSHGRLSTIIALIFIPSVLALGTGFWLAQEAKRAQDEATKEQKLGQVSTEAETLVHLLSAEIETLHAEAEALTLQLSHQNEVSTSHLSGRILHWAELEVQQGNITSVRRSVRNPLWNAQGGMENSYLQTVTRTLNLNEINTNGITLFRVKQDPNSGEEWMGIAFLSPDHTELQSPAGIASAQNAQSAPSVLGTQSALGNATGTTSSSSEKPVILVLANPSQIFSSFQRWTQTRDGERVRSYVIGNDGRVLMHSQSSLTASDFSGLSIFKDKIQKVFQADEKGGAANAQGYDHFPVAAAYFRVGNYPLAAVVEELDSSSLSWDRNLGWNYLQEVLSSVGVFAGIALIFGLYLKKTMVKTVPNQRQSQAAFRPENKYEDKFEAEWPGWNDDREPSVFQASRKEFKPSPSIEKEDEFLIRDRRRNQNFDHDL